MIFFPALICANNTGSLLNSFFGANILIPVPFFCLSYFTLPATVSCGGMNGSLVFNFSALLNLKESKVALACRCSHFPICFLIYHAHILCG